MQDGSIWMEVTIGLAINHKKGLRAATVPWDREKQRAARYRYHPKGVKYKTSAMYGQAYTGLIIDAGDLGARPSMFPKIMTAGKKKEVYGPYHVSRKYAINRGVAGYAGSVAKALLHRRVGSNPLKIKAVAADGAQKSNFLISEGDANKILAADIKKKFLKECRVVFVID